MNKYLEFYQHIESNPQAKAKLAALGEALQGTEDRETIIKALIELAEQEGFSFSVEETAQYFDSLNAEGTLSDEELEAVAGGKSSCTCMIIGTGDATCFIFGSVANGSMCTIVGVCDDTFG